MIDAPAMDRKTGAMVVGIQHIGDNDLWRVGTIGDGNCMLHSLLFALSPTYRAHAVAARKKIALEFRRVLKEELLNWPALHAESATERGYPKSSADWTWAKLKQFANKKFSGIFEDPEERRDYLINNYLIDGSPLLAEITRIFPETGAASAYDWVRNLLEANNAELPVEMGGFITRYFGYNFLAIQYKKQKIEPVCLSFMGYDRSLPTVVIHYLGGSTNIRGNVAAAASDDEEAANGFSLSGHYETTIRHRAGSYTAYTFDDATIRPVLGIFYRSCPPDIRAVMEGTIVGERSPSRRTHSRSSRSRQTHSRSHRSGSGTGSA